MSWRPNDHSRYRGPKPVIVDNDPDNPLGLPPVRWWWIPNENDVYRRLRGAAAFEMARRCGVDVLDWGNVPEGTKVEPNRYRHRIMVGNPGSEGLRNMFRRMKGWRRPPRLVVDVTFDVSQPDALVSFLPPGDPLYDHDVQVTRDFWSENLPHLIETVKLADVVTTPHEPWASSLTLFNDNVVVLPYLVDEVLAPPFLLSVASLFGDEGLVT